MGSSARKSAVPNLADLFYAEPLLQREWDGRVTPKLVTSWSWEDGGRTLRLGLKRGAILHDGTPLSAPIVAEFIGRLLPARGRSGAWGLGSVTAISAEGNDSVVMRLSAPDMFLLAALSDIRIVHPENADIGTGPFRLLTRRPQVHATRFEDYHNGLSPLGGIRIIPYETQRAAWAALLRNEVEVVQEVSRETVEFMAGSSDVRTFSSLQPFYLALLFNQRHPALRHVEVRRALIEALDRQEIVERALRGRARVAEAPIWPFHWAYTAPAERYTHSPEAAGRRLDAAGFHEPAHGPAGKLRTRFSIRCLVNSEDPEYERVALLLQRQLFNIGVDLQVQLLPFGDLTERMGRGDFDTLLVRANASRTLERTYHFWRSADGGTREPGQVSGYAGADPVLDQLRRANSDVEISKTVAALAERFYEDAPAAFLAWLEVTRAVSARFAVPQNAAPDPFMNIWEWRLVEAEGR